ncbi:31494_t:CDS:1, partial [Racocetra persica]
GPYTGIVIANAFENCIRQMGILPKLVAVTHDNASSNIKFLSEFSNSVAQ